MVKGKIFKSLKEYDNAIACFSTIINKDILEFGAILQLNITKCIKYKKVIVGAILAIIILILTQFMLFKYGILPSHVNSYDINVSNGRYIKDYVNSIVIPLDETIDIDLQYKMTPFYGKLGDISYTVEDETIISVDGNNKVTGLKIGETNLNVLINGKIEHTVAFSVVEPTLEFKHKSLLKQGNISAGYSHTVGLKSDGTVVAVGDNYNGRCDVEGWTDIVDISATRYLTVGLKSDGTVVVAGDRNYAKEWTDIVDISAGNYHIAGLKSDGTVVAAEVTSVNGNHNFGQYDIEEWTDIVDISAGISHTVGLKSDGTVVAAGENNYGEINVNGWTDIVSTSVGIKHTVGLKLDGTVVAVGDNSEGQCDVEGWEDIVAISAGAYYTVGLKSDGTVVVVGDNSEGQCEITSWSDIKVDQYN